MKKKKKKIRESEIPESAANEQNRQPQLEAKRKFISRIKSEGFESPQEAASEFKTLLEQEPKDSTEFIEETYEALFLDSDDKGKGKIDLAKCFGAGTLIGAGKYVAAAVLDGLFKNVENG